VRTTVLALGLIGLVVACVGGGGAGTDGMTMWQPAGSNVERAGSSSERAANSVEGKGGAALICGTYACQRAGDDDIDNVELSAATGGCSVANDDGVILIGFDGSVTVNGQAAGSWQSTGSGISLSIGSISLTCTQGAASEDDNSADPGRPDDTPAPSPTPVLDAGSSSRDGG
jgi:hypothetical protein